MPPLRFLCPVDFSPRSRYALRYALRMAERWPASVDVLHVLPAPARFELAASAWLGRAMPHTSEAAVHEAEERMALLLSSVSTNDTVVRTRLEPGDPAATIVRIATEEESHLILIATHGRTGLSEWVLGSVAKIVISCAPCPVLTLRGDELGVDDALHQPFGEGR